MLALVAAGHGAMIVPSPILDDGHDVVVSTERLDFHWAILAVPGRSRIELSGRSVVLRLPTTQPGQALPVDGQTAQAVRTLLATRS